MPSPHCATQHCLSDIEIGQVARDDFEHLLRLPRVAALISQTLDTLTKLTGAVFRLGDPLGNSEKCDAILGHVSTLSSVRGAAGTESLCRTDVNSVSIQRHEGTTCNCVMHLPCCSTGWFASGW